MNDTLDLSDKYIAAGSAEVAVTSLEEWSADASSSLRRRVAENPHTPLVCLIKLAKDECTEVRIAVAENQSTPDWLLEEFLQSEDADLRYAMAENSNLVPAILQALAQDENPYVAHRAALTIKRNAPAKIVKMKLFDKGVEALECIWQVKIS